MRVVSESWSGLSGTFVPRNKTLESELGFRACVAITNESYLASALRMATIRDRCRMAHLWGVLRASRKGL